MVENTINCIKLVNTIKELGLEVYEFILPLTMTPYTHNYRKLNGALRE